MARLNHVNKARKDIVQNGTVIVKAGEPYYWWKFRFGGKRVSKERPRRSQLTQSAFLSGLYEVEDQIEANLPADDGLKSAVEEMIGELEALRDQCQESLDNMPEHLQEASESGQLLQERIGGLESWISDLEGVDCEVSEDEDADPEADDYEPPEDKYQLIIDEIQGMNPGLS